MGECQGGTWNIPAACYEGETSKPGNFYIADHFNSGSEAQADLGPFCSSGILTASTTGSKQSPEAFTSG